MSLFLSLLLLSWAPDRAEAQDWVRSLIDEVPKASSVAGKPAVQSGQPLVVSSSGAAVIGWGEFTAAIAAARVLYAGEQHDQAVHHAIQLEMLKEFHAKDPAVTVGLEMLDFTQQGALDDYLSGKTSEADFAEFWKKAWGFDFALYRPILAWAKTNRVPVRALNAPISVIRQVAKGGLASLSPAQRAQLPARVEPISDPRYLAYVKKSLSEHGPMDPVREGRMLEAMAAWNETMGQNVVDLLGRGRVGVVAGMGHMLYDAGIAESVRRRSPAKQTVILPYPMNGTSRPAADLLKDLQDPASEDIGLADYFRLVTP